jgi:hypothetical protein
MKSDTLISVILMAGIAMSNAKSILPHIGSGDADGHGINSAPPVQPMPLFDALVNALVERPIPGLGVVGENGATAASSTVFWFYNRVTGLELDGRPGFLSTGTGNGGFSIHVAPNGDWHLHFYGAQKTLGYDTDDHPPTPAPSAPPAGNRLVDTAAATAVPPGPNTYFYDASAGDTTFDGTTLAGTPISGFDTVAGGLGDYIIGGTAPHTSLPGGSLGNCAIYTNSPGPVLIDGQNGLGFGGSAEGNVLVNINQLRGSLFSNVLIGNAAGEDLKSGGSNSVLISTGGVGYELRPDGGSNVLVSTVGADRVLFDPNHGWSLGDLNTMLGFNSAHGTFLDLSLIPNTFHTTPGAKISDYVQLVNAPDGEHVMFNGNGHVQTAGVDILNLELVHGLTAEGLYASHNLVL